MLIFLFFLKVARFALCRCNLTLQRFRYRRTPHTSINYINTS